ncbi:ATP-binding cassette domain-containing protein [Streptomyces sp. NBC_01485]|uniref:ATP-binding cassette domain-containing protein n=1 Tax=Streptomyces sp. NBC_01485 TaxID=2903884 RepID=UPI002E380CAE|nr:ATP-binding cassette domain-containing protein [Streptomyces sp. NBC_01485]
MSLATSVTNWRFQPGSCTTHRTGPHVGVSGSGKTTSVRAIVGLQAATGGTILLDGTALGSGLRGRDRAQRHRVQLVTQLSAVGASG